MKILVISTSLQPTCKIHAITPLLALEKKNLDLNWRFKHPRLVDLLQLEWADIVWFIRDCDPYSQNLAVWAKCLGSKVIYDLDDNLGIIPTNSELGRVAFANDLRTAVSQMASIADNVGLTSNTLMQDMCGINQASMRPQYMENTEHFSSYIRDKVDQIVTSARNVTEKLTIVSPTVRSLDQDFLSKVLRTVIKNMPNQKIEFLTFAHNQKIDEDVLSEIIFTKKRPINNHQRYIKYLTSLNNAIGLAYLEDSHFNRSKTQAKYRDFAISGIPGVFSNVIPYSNSVKDCLTGMLAENDPQEWSNRIVEICNDSSLRSEIAKGAFQDLEENYTFEAYLNHIYQVFSELTMNRSIIPPIHRKSNLIATPAVRLVAFPGDTGVKRLIRKICNANNGLVLNDSAPNMDDRIPSIAIRSCRDKEHDYVRYMDLKVLTVHLENCSCTESFSSHDGERRLYDLNSESKIVMDAIRLIVSTPLKHPYKSNRFVLSRYAVLFRNWKTILQNRVEILRLTRRS